MASLQDNEPDGGDLGWLGGSIAEDEEGDFGEPGEKEYSSFENQAGA